MFGAGLDVAFTNISPSSNPLNFCIKFSLLEGHSRLLSPRVLGPGSLANAPPLCVAVVADTASRWWHPLAHSIGAFGSTFSPYEMCLFITGCVGVSSTSWRIRSRSLPVSFASRWPHRWPHRWEGRPLHQSLRLAPFSMPCCPSVLHFAFAPKLRTLHTSVSPLPSLCFHLARLAFFQHEHLISHEYPFLRPRCRMNVSTLLSSLSSHCTVHKEPSKLWVCRTDEASLAKTACQRSSGKPNCVASSRCATTCSSTPSDLGFFATDCSAPPVRAMSSSPSAPLSLSSFPSQSLFSLFVSASIT